jgi:hypothetical protein
MEIDIPDIDKNLVFSRPPVLSAAQVNGWWPEGQNSKEVFIQEWLLAFEQP